jgi:hypothetical protein
MKIYCYFLLHTCLLCMTFFDYACSPNLRTFSQVTQTQDVLVKPSCPINLKTAREGELEHRTQYKVDSIAVINNLRIKPSQKSRMLVPLCRMIPMAKVRPVGEVGVQHLEREFVKGYRDGDRVMYISMYNNDKQTRDVTDEVMAKWSPLWRDANDAFEFELQSDEDWSQFSGKMFFVWEGNHRLSAWLRHINKHHADDPSWHISVQCIVLDPRGHVGNLLHAMHDINW